ncbi:two-component system, sensor histidine kinase YesM [Paenibacillus sp. yr247]|uniref:sensor histidine kinase n=1 Tax=Paenibacillus sp. yr247 TaxID=1761880 RepID=UPI000880C4A6|nr:sensor histidine kinase [Paenibacillus sp. yr247]SDN96865.1 two-component system, sensor histidine kinase YesM [Paenibacillus sp. yr247]
MIQRRLPMPLRFLAKTFLNLSLHRKLFAVFCIVSILPLLFFVKYSYDTTTRELTTQIYTNMIATTDQINTNLETKLDSYSRISASIYLDNTLRLLLTKDYTENSTEYLDSYIYFNNVINNILATNPDIRAVSIYTNNTTFPADSVYIKRIDDAAKKTNWYESIAHSYGNVTYSVSARATETEPVFKLVRLLNNNSLNFPYGILTFDIAEADIYRLMEKEDKQKDIYIVNESGNILSNRNKALLNQNIGTLIPGTFGENKSGSFDSMYNGEKSLVVYNTIKNGWRTISVIPYKSFITNAQIASKRILFIALCSIAISVVLIYITARFFTKRIESLLQVIRRVEREDFNVNMKFMGHDEIGQLSFAFKKMTGRLKELINEVYKKEISKKEAEMNMLQAQINPHFLYNTLASISALAVKHSDNTISEMVSHLAKFYRISLNKGKMILPIIEEIKLTKYYIAIQQHRFEGLLRLHYAIDDSVLVYQTVKLALQPFVENAINHAVWDDEVGINIIIRVYKDDRDIYLEVIDDGMGMRAETLERALNKTDNVSGYGITNVDQRIKLAFGDEYGVTLYSKFGIGTKAQIRIPLHGISS